MRRIEDFPGVCTELIKLIGVDNFICKSTVDYLKIQTSNPGAYRTLVHYLRNEKAEFHTFQLKEVKPMRIVLEPTDHSNEIFKLESLLHAKIKIEEPHKPKIISQCQNCQAYGHTKAYCG